MNNIKKIDLRKNDDTMPWFLSCFLACHPQPEDAARDPQKPYFLLAEKYVIDRIRNLAPSLALQMEAHIWFKLLRAQST